jgi:protein-S-isoprenylcysteine O-methyltransferase Ste14
MSLPVALAFFTIAFLGPIPLWHLLLHAFLPAWRLRPRAFYVLAAAVWVLFVPLSWHLAAVSPCVFVPSPWMAGTGFALSGAAFLVFLWCVATLTPRRFFAWAALRPGPDDLRRIVRGPYRVAAHPCYCALVLTVASHGLASGQAVLLGAAVVIGVLLAGVAVLEQRELSARRSPSLPVPELVSSPLAASTRE